jgi:hypothetical protein
MSSKMSVSFETSCSLVVKKTSEPSAEAPRKALMESPFPFTSPAETRAKRS